MIEVTKIDEIIKTDIKAIEDAEAENGIAPMVKKTDDDAVNEEYARYCETNKVVINDETGEIEVLNAVVIDDIKTACTDASIEGCCGEFLDKKYDYIKPAPVRQKVFDSGLKVIRVSNEKVRIEIPKLILNVCDEIQDKMNHNEFSIVCKGKWGDEGEYVVDEIYEVPKQKVAGASVDYDLDHLEQLKMQGFNTVIHSHPFKSSNFSSSDNETINSHFECSILYSVREFTAATVAFVPVSGVKLITVGDPHIIGEDIVPKAQIDNIEVPKPVVTHYNDDYWYGGVYYKSGNAPKNNDLERIQNANRGHSFQSEVGKRDTFGGRGRSVDSRCKCRTREDKADWKYGDYRYDADKDILFKDGIPVEDFNKSARSRANFTARSNKVVQGNLARVNEVNAHAQQLPVRVHQVPEAQVFHSEGVKVFRASDAEKNKPKGKKK